MRWMPIVLVVVVATLLPGCVAMHYIPAGRGVRGETPPEVEVVRLPTSDGLTLEGRLYPPDCERPRAKDSAGAPPPRLPDTYRRTIILHCHGVADNNTSAMACFFSEGGFRVFQFDYRGFGHSDPAPLSNAGFADDAVAALRYLRSRPDVDPDRILVYGHSMGAAYALAAASGARAEGHPVRAVVTANGFSSWRLVANHHLPVLGFLFGGVPGPDPVQWARRLGDTPYLVGHVQDDDAVPVENASRLYAAAVGAKVPASLYIYPQGGHAFPFMSSLEDNGFERAMVDFARTWLAEKPPMTARQREALWKGGWSIEIKGTQYERAATLDALIGTPASAPNKEGAGAPPKSEAPLNPKPPQ